jgi:hypothetical protein
MSENVADLGDNINTINESVAQIIPLLDDYIAIVQDLATDLASVQTGLEAQGQNIKIGIIAISIWFALYQIVPLYVGWTMLTGNGRDTRDEVVVESETTTKRAVVESVASETVVDKTIVETEETMATDETVEIAGSGEEEQK